MTEQTAGVASREHLGVEEDSRLREFAGLPVFSVFQRVAGSPRGLTEQEAEDRLRRFGDNESFRHPDDAPSTRIVAALRSPFVALLAGLDAVFVAIGDVRGATTVTVMTILAVLLRIWQQTRSVRAARALGELVTSTATVRRRADVDNEPVNREVPLQDLVPGDIVVLRAGDVVPADLRILSSTDLVVDQSVLSGESLPASKTPVPAESERPGNSLVDTPSLCFSGTAVVAGVATAVVVATGAHTYSGSLARSASRLRPESSFDRGVRRVGWTLVRFMLVMSPVVFLTSGIVSGSWARAAMFAVAVAVGLTPEMLPVILTTNLARGATRLARDKVIVSRLNAIQDLGAMDVLCVDKTGTLTEDRIVYAHSIDATGRADDSVAELAYLAVHFQEMPYNRLDEAIAAILAEQGMSVLVDAAYTKVDEIAFDHTRRRSAVVVSRQRGEHILICKGDPDEILPRCTRARLDGETVMLDEALKAEAYESVSACHRHGMRVLAVALRSGPTRLERSRETDEQNLVLAGFVGFVDPIRDSAAGAVRSLVEHGVEVKILTGDNRTVARQVAAQVGVDADVTVLGHQIDGLSASRLRTLAEEAGLFAELSPMHKTRIVAALREAGHAVGFLGDGVNDATALRVADAGIAADTATEVAKHAADFILLDKDLAVVARGVVEGRRTLANTMKYVKITTSSNFGDALSVVLASMLLPFLPMLPIQMVITNLLYDTAQLSLPWDRVHDAYLRKPRRWDATGLIPFMVIFGGLSTVFDLATFAVMWWVFGAAHSPRMFQTAWFLESVLTALLVVLVLRAPTVPWRGARPASAVVAATAGAAAIGLLLPVSPLAAGLQMTAPPATYLLWLLAVTSAYLVATYVVKKRYLRRHQAWL